MTCAGVRDRFSARVDDALTADERAAFEAHLASCAECRREWRRFELTVGLVRAVEPARAPAGFVDRVVAAARPWPWYGRLLRGAFVPWPAKLPLEAAAIVLVAGLVSLIFQHTGENEPTSRLSAPANIATAPPSAPPAKRDSRARAFSGERDATPPARPPGPASATSGVADATTAAPSATLLNQARRNRAAAERSAAPSEHDVGRGSAYAPAPAVSHSVADMEARLAAADPAKAEQAVSALVARLAGARSDRTAEPGVLELVVPRESYAALTAELARVGRLRVDRAPPNDADPIRIRLRLD